MIKTTEMKLKESFGLCPYLREIQKEARRNAKIKDELKDISEMDETTDQLRAHLSRRVDRQTKNKWVPLAAKFAEAVGTSGPIEKAEIRRYLENARSRADEINRREKEHDWVRTPKVMYDEMAW